MNTGEDPTLGQTMNQDIEKEDIMIEVKAEREEGEMEQIEPESNSMGGQVDPEATAGRPNV